jgi:CSLREA domain-containing protein
MKGRLQLSVGVGLAATALLLGLLARAAPTPARAAGGEVFTVDTALDYDDATTGDCICAADSGDCTLRAAIQEANACSGPQEIRFGSPVGIQPVAALPPLTDDGTVIDGSDWWMVGSGLGCPGVEINGYGAAFNGLEITGSDSAVYGVAVIRFGRYGVYVHGGAQNNHIGGAGFHQRNVISRNGGSGVLIEGATTTTNTVEANYIGTNPEGTSAEWSGVADWGNGQHGVSVWVGSGNVISGNLVANNGWSGVAADLVGPSSISYNRIGMDIYGQPLGNSFYGVHLAHGSWPNVSYNDIAFNGRGIFVEGGSDPWIYHNLIYSNTASALATPHGGGILITGSGTHSIVNYNEILSNTARYGGGIAVEDGAAPAIHNNTISGNTASAPGTVQMAGGGVYVWDASVNIHGNSIISNTATGPDESPLPRGGGVCLDRVAGGSVSDNEIRGNVVDGNAGGGGGLSVIGGSSVEIKRNRLVDNHVTTSSWGGSAIDINGYFSSPSIVVDANWVSDNSTIGGGAVYVYKSSHISFTNNLIVDNGDSGLYLHSTGTDIASTNNTIAVNSGSGIELNDARLELYNTILVSNTHYGIYVQGGWSLVETRNDVWGNALGGANGFSGFYLEVDPRFFDAAAGMYALRPGSPCIDDGDWVHATPNSFNGLTRPQGGGYDLGAYEMPLPLCLPLVLRSY